MTITGKGILLPTSVPATCPTAYDDLAMLDGSLLLIQPDHEASQRDYLALTALPTNGLVGGNIAWEQAAVAVNDAIVYAASISSTAMAGTTTPLTRATARAAVDPTFVIGSSFGTTKGKMERTTLGSLHLISSQTVDDVNTHAGWNMPLAIKNYIDLYSDGYPTLKHEFALFLHTKTTRAGAAAGNALIAAIFQTSNGAALLAARTDTDSPASGSGQNCANAPLDTTALNTVGLETMRGLGSTCWPASANPTGALMSGRVGIGPTGPFTTLHKSGGLIIRRAHLVDLTRGDNGSPVTFLQMYARELAVSVANLAVGGAWYNDTWATDLTNPATFP